MNIRDLNPFAGRRTDVVPLANSPITALQREIDRVFDGFTQAWPSFGSLTLMPRMDVVERDDSIELTAELPGLEEKDVEVTLKDNVLYLKGEKKSEREETEGGRKFVERSYGTFSRAIELPPGISADAIRASMAKGVLTLTLPKPTPSAADATRIAVKGA